MKKFVAILMAVVLVMALSVTTFAADSPVGEAKYTVYTIDGQGAATGVKMVQDGKNIAVTAEGDGEFDGWKIYTADGKEAVCANPEGVSTASLALGTPFSLATISINSLTASLAKATADYTIIEGSLTSEKLVIEPHTNLIVTANYDGVVTEFNINNGEVESPATGDVIVLALAVVMMMAIVSAFVSKKQLAK